MAALRLRFAYEGRRIELVSAERVNATAPRPPVSQRGIGGFRLELWDADESALFARVLHDPFGESAEFPSGDPGRPFERTTVENPSGTFSVLVPAPGAAVEVALFEGTREDAPEGFATLEERARQAPIARFPLPDPG